MRNNDPRASRLNVGFCVLTYLLSLVTSTSPQTIQVTTSDGGSAAPRREEASGVNIGSSLHRKWSVLHDSRMPLNIDGDFGIQTAPWGEAWAGRAEGHATASE